MSEPIRELDPSLYLRTPVLNVASGVALGIALLSALPKGLPPNVRKTAKQVRASVVELQALWAAQRAAASQTRPDPRPLDLRLDRAWAAVGRRLRDLADLADTLPEGVTASRLWVRLFPAGLEFLKLPYERQWAESEQLVRLFDEPDIRSDIERLVGDFLIAEVREAHRVYGEGLGITTPRGPNAAPVVVAEGLRSLQQAIGAHSLQIVAAAAADPDLLPLARQALRPLDDLRAAMTRRTSSNNRGGPSQEAGEGESAVPSGPTDVDVSPATPVPELDESGGG